MATTSTDEDLIFTTLFCAVAIALLLCWKGKSCVNMFTTNIFHAGALKEIVLENLHDFPYSHTYQSCDLVRLQTLNEFGLGQQ